MVKEASTAPASATGDDADDNADADDGMGGDGDDDDRDDGGDYGGDGGDDHDRDDGGDGTFLRFSFHLTAHLPPGFGFVAELELTTTSSPTGGNRFSSGICILTTSFSRRWFPPSNCPSSDLG